MKIENNNVNKGGVGFCGLLTIALIVLKVSGCVNISWFWVFSPVILLSILIILVILITLYILFK